MRFLHRLPSTIVLLCAACVPAFPDSVKVDNSFVRITEVTESPEASLKLGAQATDRLLISVGTGDVWIDKKGRSQQQSWAPGQAFWLPADEPMVLKNVGSIPLQLIEVELKTSTSGDHEAPNAKLDPVVIDPEHNVLVLDNDRVRVFGSWREPGATEKMHEHTGRGRIAILLTGLDATVKTGDGAVTVSRAAKGDVLWSGPVIHATTNLSSQRFEMVIVEVK